MTETTHGPMHCERRTDAVAIVTHRAAPMNAFGLEAIAGLAELTETLATDDNVRAIVLTAEGERAFSVGMNLKEMGKGLKAAGGIDALLDERLDLISRIETMDKPWVATMFGHTLGGGLEVALGCTFRLAATEGAQIGLPELELGTVPAWGGTARLAKSVGRQRALEMILRSRKIDGAEAHRIGLADELWPLAELRDQAVAFAVKLASQPRAAVKGMLDALGHDRTVDELIAAERAAVHASFASPDSAEGMTAFMEKRPPVFNAG